MKYTEQTINLRCSFTSRSAEVDVICEGKKSVMRFVCITDLDEGMSVTNDIEAVLAVLTAEGVLMPDMRVVYRDTEKVWDQVIIDRQCCFVRFAPLRAPTSDIAITLAISREGNTL